MRSSMAMAGCRRWNDAIASSSSGQTIDEIDWMRTAPDTCRLACAT